MRTVSSDDDLDKITIYGRDDWKRELEKYVDPSERTVDFGGFNEQGLTVNEILDTMGTGAFSCAR